MLTRVYLSLGSNVGNRAQNLKRALTRLEDIGRIVQVSHFYETEPVDFTAQPWFLNAVVALDTTQLPRELLNALLALEQSMGRKRDLPKGPRTIDLDILLYGDQTIHEDGLTIPHPALPARRFVLEPLAEIAPDLIHPVLKRSMRDLRDELPPGQSVRKLANLTPTDNP